MKVGIIVYPGTTCDRDTFIVIKEVMGWDVRYIFYQERILRNIDLVIMPGGFSYGDYLRVGALARFSPVSDAIYRHTKNGGLALGICNGFQILLEMGLLSGALMQNSSGRFVCKNVYIRTEESSSLLTAGTKKETVFQMPIAHRDGNYYIDVNGLHNLKERDLIVLKYCTKDGEITESSNPNGSVDNIAGIRNENGNVVGLMPHPERAALPFHKTRAGEKFFLGIEKFLGK